MRQKSDNMSRRNARKGIVLILVLIVLLLIVVMGIVYMNVARLDKLATVSLNSTYSDRALNLGINTIRSELQLDVIGTDEGYLNGNPGPSAAPGQFSYSGFFDNGYGGESTSLSARVLWAPVPDEPFDYPWTTPETRSIPGDPRGDNPDFGGDGDDRWLASMVPEFDSVATGVWRHTSDFRTRFPGDSGGYHIFNVPYLTDVGFAPEPTDANLDEIYHQNLDILNVNGIGGADWDPANPDADQDGYLDFEQWAADADGDGIPDARWQYMPTRQINDITYVWAVRVVDLSGKANLAIATALTDGAGAYANADRSRFDNPAELDLARLASDTSFIGSTTASSELSALLAWRTGSAAFPTPRSTRIGFWEGAGRRPINAEAIYNVPSLDSEIDLLYRNGLNHPDIRSQLETVMNGSGSVWLRTNDLQERSWAAADPSTISSIRDYFEKNPRLYLTTLSGSSVYTGLPRMVDSARVAPGADRHTHNNVLMHISDDSYASYEDEGTIQRNLSHWAVPGRVQQLSYHMRMILDRNKFSYGPSSPGAPYKDDATGADAVPYGFLYNMMAPHQSARHGNSKHKRREMMANQIAASVKDFVDDDSGKTRVTVVHSYDDEADGYTGTTYNDTYWATDPSFIIGGLNMRVGMERLPFVTEVYSHHPYSVTVDTADSNTDPTNHTYAVHFDRMDASNKQHAAYCIQIVNPHPTAISLNGVYASLSQARSRKLEWVSGIWDGFADPDTMDNDYVFHLGDYHATLGANESLYIYRNSAADPGLDILSFLGIPSTAKTINWTNPDANGLKGPFDNTRGNNGDPSGFPNQSLIDKLPRIALFVRADDERLLRWPYQELHLAPTRRLPRIPVASGNEVIEYDDPNTITPDSPDGLTFYMPMLAMGSAAGLNAMANVSPRVIKNGGSQTTGNGFPAADQDGDWDTDNTAAGHFWQYDAQNMTGGANVPIHPTNSIYGGSPIDLAAMNAMTMLDKTSKGGPPKLEMDLDGDGTDERLEDETWPINNSGTQATPTDILRVPLLSIRPPESSRNPMGKALDLPTIFRSQPFGHAPTFMEHFMIDMDTGILQRYMGSTDFFPKDFQWTSTYAWFVNRYDMLSPADDGVDNDGDGVYENGVDDDGDGAIDEERADGIDNDRDGTIDENDQVDTSEMLIPGRLNLNTAPYEVIVRMLPIPDDGLRTRVARRIVLFRENPDVSGTPWRELPKAPHGHDWTDATQNDENYGCGLPAEYRDEPGIVYLGELAAALDGMFATDNVSNTSINGITIDETPDSIVDDREERLMIVDWLLNTCSTRSDFFAAYILIRGYKDGEFDKEPVEERRVYVIFDRSEILTRYTPAKILSATEVGDD